MINYQGKNVVIIGLGITGLSCVEYFLTKNIIPRVIDTRANPAGLDQLDKRVEIYLGGLNLSWLLDADIIIASPGIALSTPELVQAKEQGVEIIGDIELFCREVNLLDNKKIVAITGANGKTTVTTLIGEIIKAAGLKVGVGGNIGKPALTLLNEDNDIYVLELSSFQLETTYSLCATVATILNISEDHMDRYPEGLDQYVLAKQRIYHNAKNCVINHDDKLTFPQDLSCSTNYVEFGLKQGKYHLDELYRFLMVDDESVIATDKINLLGVHNYLNALAVLAIADLIAIERTVSINTIANFTGLSHRFELVLKHKGIMWINDSKATNVGSTEAALKSVVCQGTLFLLLGGDGKSADFSPLLPYLLNRDIAIYCFGRDRHQLANLRPEVTTVVETMNEAITDLVKKVKPNDVILLSPACASLDQFKNYVERGNVFTSLAKELG